MWSNWTKEEWENSDFAPWNLKCFPILSILVDMDHFKIKKNTLPTPFSPLSVVFFCFPVSKYLFYQMNINCLFPHAFELLHIFFSKRHVTELVSSPLSSQCPGIFFNNQFSLDVFHFLNINTVSRLQWDATQKVNNNCKVFLKKCFYM